jgi:hypothetical protein
MSALVDYVEPKIHVYIVFHNKVFENLYEELNDDDKKNITLYGVKNTHNTKLNIIYEFDLQIYNKNLQENIYNEGSSFYHIFKNSYLYKNYDYIGFGQYDMKLFANTFNNIKKIIHDNPNEKCIFVSSYFPDIKKTGFLGGHNLIKHNLNQLESGITSYNRVFNKNYTPENVIENKLISCNTFVITTQLYEKMMSWLISYYIDDIKQHIHPLIDNAGCILEGLIGMFLSLEVFEGSKYYNFEIEHIWPHYKNLSNS